jgi:hypothetical protein
VVARSFAFLDRTRTGGPRGRSPQPLWSMGSPVQHRRLTTGAPRTAGHHACRRSRHAGHQPSRQPPPTPADVRRTSRTAPRQALPTHSRAHPAPSTARRRPAPPRNRVILSARPPRPARPEKGTTAMVAPRRSSSFQIAERETISHRAGRKRALCARAAGRPDGVEQPSPGAALQVGHDRSSQPRATWRCATGSVRPRQRRSHRQRWQRAPGAARQSGHDCSSHAARSLMVASRKGRCAPGAPC